MNNITALIPARGGSKTLPGKNIKEFAGKPLIIHSIEYALGSKFIDEVVVSTDDSQISKISRDAGAAIIKRPDELSTDTAATESAVEHYLNSRSKKPDIIVLLQATSPLRPKNSLDEAITYFIKEKFDSLLSISQTHRFFWRVKEDKTAYAEYDYLNRPRRQDLQQVDMRFIENGSLYIFTRDHFEKTGNRLGGKTGFVEWSEDYNMEIDTEVDFQCVEKIFKSLNS